MKKIISIILFACISLNIFADEVKSVLSNPQSNVQDASKTGGGNNDAFRGNVLNLFDFLTEQQIKDILANTATVDCTSAIQKALNAARGKTLIVPAGTYLLKDNNQRSLLNISGTITIEAQRGSIFLIDSSVPNETDVITVHPLSLADEGVTINGLWVYEKSGAPARNILKVALDAKHGLKKLRLKNNLFRAKAGLAIWVENPNNANNRGLFLSEIANNEIFGGIRLDGLGDSNYIADNVITGPNTGIEFSMLDEMAAAGSAAKLQILRNNITSANGAIRGAHARGIVIEDNNIEQTEQLQNGYSVDLSYIDEVNSARPLASMAGVSVIARNKIEPADPKSKANGILLYKCNGTIVEYNSFGSSQNGKIGTTAITVKNSVKTIIRGNFLFPSSVGTGINIDADSISTEYSRGIYSPVSPTSIEVSDSGIGTKGVWRNAMLSPDWQNVTSKDKTFLLYKTKDYFVELKGQIAKINQIKDGDTLGTLPAGFSTSTENATNVSELNLVAYALNSTTNVIVPILLKIVRSNSENISKLILKSKLAPGFDVVVLDGVHFYSPDISITR